MKVKQRKRRKKDGFARVLSRVDVMALAVGAMIGWGWIVLVGDWIQIAGTYGAMLAFALGGLLVLFVGLTYAELTAAMPESGGEQVFSYRALGRNMSFICTWAIILGYISVVAFEAVALPTVIEYLFPNYVKGYMYTIAGYDVHLTWVLVGMISSIIIIYINLLGVKTAAFMQVVFTMAVAGVGVLFLGGSAFNGSVANINSGFVDGTKGLLSVVIMTPFMFVGFDVIPQAAGEIDMPFNKIGKLILGSVIMAVVWYILIIYGVSLALTEAQIASSNLVTADAMSAVFFNSGIASKIMVIAGITGILTSWNAFYIGGSRAIYAMAKAEMLPKFLGILHPKHKTPVNAILLIGVLSTLSPLLGRKMLSWLANAGGLTIVVAYLIVSISFLVLRYKEPEMVRPYRVRKGKTIGFIAIFLSLCMAILYMPGAPASLLWPYEWAIILGWSILGIIFFIWARFYYKAPKTKE
ncbi:MAG TPA: APC family permease [Clostridia bacterium]|nr:APC family permease [Clostridia bacterium]